MEVNLKAVKKQGAIDALVSYAKNEIILLENELKAFNFRQATHHNKTISELLVELDKTKNEV